MLAAVAPEAAAWSTFFAAGASLRLAVDAGRFDAVDAEHAERTLSRARRTSSTRSAVLLEPARPRTRAPVARPLRALRAS